MFHLNPTGNPGKCQATQGKCPYGSQDEHFSSAYEARRNFESKQSSFTALSPVSKQNSTKIDLDDSTFNNDDHALDYTPDQVSQKYEADIHGRTFPLLQKMNPGEPGLVLERLFGKEPDSDPTADLGSVELKTLRASSIARPVSLGSLLIEGNVGKLRKLYLGDKFQHTLKAGEWSHVDGNYYSLLVDRKQRKVRVIIANKDKEFVSTNDFGWSFDSLDKKVDKKLASIAVGLYETKDDHAGHRAVTFKNLLLGGFTHESMIDKLEQGKVNIDFRFNERYARTTLTSRAEDFCDKAEVEKAL